MDRIQKLTHALAVFADTAWNSSLLSDWKRRLVLQFVVRVASTLEQSFTVAQGLLLELAQEEAESGQPLGPRASELKARAIQVGGAAAAPALVGELHQLLHVYCECIEPLLRAEPALAGSRGLGCLIHPVYGEIAQASGACARDIDQLIERLDSPHGVAARAVARRRGETLDGELWELRALSWQLQDRVDTPEQAPGRLDRAGGRERSREN